MPLPTISNPDEQPCAPWLRKGHKCHRSAKDCKFTHIPLDNLSAESKEEWKAFQLANNDQILFNPSRVKTLGTALTAAAMEADDDVKEPASKKSKGDKK